MTVTLIDTIFLVVVGAVAVVSWQNKRGLLWLALITLGFFVSGFYWRSGLGAPELVAGMCDATICMSIFLLARQKWELWVFSAFLACIAVNIVYLINNLAGAGVIDHEVYSIALEALNAAAIATIGGVSAFQRIGSTNGVAFHPWRSILGFVLPSADEMAPHKGR
jgi:hypothetical protein